MKSLKMVEIGDGLGVILPSDVLAIFNDAKDGTGFLTEMRDGFTLTTVDPNASPAQTTP